MPGFLAKLYRMYTWEDIVCIGFGSRCGFRYPLGVLEHIRSWIRSRCCTYFHHAAFSSFQAASEGCVTIQQAQSYWKSQLLGGYIGESPPLWKAWWTNWSDKPRLGLFFYRSQGAAYLEWHMVPAHPCISQESGLASRVDSRGSLFPLHLQKSGITACEHQAFCLLQYPLMAGLNLFFFLI